MSKLYNQNIPISLIPKYIDVTLIKEQGSRANIANSITSTQEYVKKLSAAINNIAHKVKNVFSMTSEWLESVKDAHKLDLSEKKNVHLKIWKSLIEMESWRSTDQLKLILTRFQADIKARYHLNHIILTSLKHSDFRFFTKFIDRPRKHFKVKKKIVLQ